MTDALRAELAAHASDDGLVGVSCLARGADQLFARVVLELGGALEVVLPAADYRSRKVKVDHTAVFDELIGQATTVRTLPFETSNRESYLAASERLLSTVELMMAVWDGQPADGCGGTGDVVERARALGLPVTVVWPAEAARERTRCSPINHSRIVAVVPDRGSLSVAPCTGTLVCATIHAVSGSLVHVAHKSW